MASEIESRGENVYAKLIQIMRLDLGFILAYYREKNRDNYTNVVENYVSPELVGEILNAEMTESKFKTESNDDATFISDNEAAFRKEWGSDNTQLMDYLARAMNLYASGANDITLNDGESGKGMSIEKAGMALSPYFLVKGLANNRDITHLSTKKALDVGYTDSISPTQVQSINGSFFVFSSDIVKVANKYIAKGVASTVAEKKALYDLKNGNPDIGVSSRYCSIFYNKNTIQGTISSLAAGAPSYKQDGSVIGSGEPSLYNFVKDPANLKAGFTRVLNDRYNADELAEMFSKQWTKLIEMYCSYTGQSDNMPLALDATNQNHRSGLSSGTAIIRISDDYDAMRDEDGKLVFDDLHFLYIPNSIKRYPSYDSHTKLIALCLDASDYVRGINVLTSGTVSSDSDATNASGESISGSNKFDKAISDAAGSVESSSDSTLDLNLRQSYTGAYNRYNRLHDKYPEIFGEELAGGKTGSDENIRVFSHLIAQILGDVDSLSFTNTDGYMVCRPTDTTITPSASVSRALYALVCEKYPVAVRDNETFRDIQKLATFVIGYSEPLSTLKRDKDSEGRIKFDDVNPFINYMKLFELIATSVPLASVGGIVNTIITAHNAMSDRLRKSYNEKMGMPPELMNDKKIVALVSEVANLRDCETVDVRKAIAEYLESDPDNYGIADLDSESTVCWLLLQLMYVKKQVGDSGGGFIKEWLNVPNNLFDLCQVSGEGNNPNAAEVLSAMNVLIPGDAVAKYYGELLAAKADEKYDSYDMMQHLRSLVATSTGFLENKPVWDTVAPPQDETKYDVNEQKSFADLKKEQAVASSNVGRRSRRSRGRFDIERDL